MLEHLSTVPTAPGRVAIIGARGFVGGAVASLLARHGVPTLPLGRDDVDLLAPDAGERLAGLLRPDDAVVAVAAIAPCKTAVMLTDNMVVVSAMLKALAAVPVAHVVNISSDAVYPDEPVPLNEDTPAAPSTLHGAMHLAREIMFRAEVTAPLAIVRPTLIYGARDPHNGYGPNRFRRLAAAGQEITLFGEGEERRDHVAVDDVAELVRRVLFHHSQGVVNAVTGVVSSFRDIAEQVVALSGTGATIRGTPRRGQMPHNGYRPFETAVCARAFPDFRWTPLGEGLLRAMEEERAGAAR